MADLIELKKTLKQWESQFIQEHNRKPGKSDIAVAPTDIKDLYVKYTNLKKAQILVDPEGAKTVATKSSLTETKGESDEVKNGEGSDNTKDTEEDYDEVDGDVTEQTKYGGEVWGSQFDRKITNKNNPVEIAKETKKTSSYLDNLGSKMFQRSLKMDRFQSLKGNSNQWRKPDTPRRGLAPFKFESPSMDGQATTPSKFESPAMDGQATDGSLDGGGGKQQLADEPFKEPCQPFEDESDKTCDNVETIDDYKPAKFGKLFDKAVTMTTRKVDTQNVDVVNSDIFVNNYHNRSKGKSSILPQSISKMVTKHRAKIQEQLEMETENCAESYNSNDDLAKNYDEPAETVDDEEEEEVAGGHSWDVSVKSLIMEDMKNKMKMDKAKAKLKSKPPKGPDKAKQKPEHLHDTDHHTKSELTVLSENETATTKLKSKNSNAEQQSLDSETNNFGNRKKNKNHNKSSEFISDNIGTKKRQTKSEDEENVYDFDNKEDEKEEVKPKRGKRTVKAKRKAPESDDNDMDVDVADNDGPDAASDGEAEDDKSNGKKKRKATKATKSSPEAKRRKANTGGVVKNEEEGISKTMPVKCAAPREKKLSNDNFLRLNMKIKTYKRKGQHLTGSQHKRKMWKQKMQSRSQSRGDGCFKCGQAGHWANKCPGAGYTNKYAKEPVTEEDFPSMQEAAMLAKGIKLKKSAQATKTPKSAADNEEAADINADDIVRRDNTREPVSHVTAGDQDVDLEIQSGIVRSRREVSTTPPCMEPLLQCGKGETLPETPNFVWQGLKKFGYDEFRPGQEEAVMRILCGLSTLVVLSTGGGKSLCYQLPAYLYSQRGTCITLVISPLVSLMEDQVTGLPNGIRGVCLHTNMTASQRESVLTLVKDGKAQFLLVSPEAIAGGSMSLISSMASLPPVAFVCIDEAHCLSEWSHNFRPSYLRLCKVLHDKLGIQCFLGLTATATLSTAADVSRHLRISDFRRATVRGSPIPSNLYLSISRDDSREQALVGLLQGDRFCELNSIIIYCTRRDQTEKVACMIRTCLNKGVPLQAGKPKSKKKGPKLEWDAESYHAGLSPAKRKSVQNAFMSGRLRVVVATVAFGMGLDKSDVRGIIHYNMPKSFESYVQEIGRAGRDRKPAQCHVFLDPEGKDLCELRRHTYANTVDFKTLKKLVQKVFPSCRCRDVHERHAQAVKEAGFDVDELEDIFNDDESMHPDDHDDTATPGGSTTVTKTTTTVSPPGERLCPGHERALPIEQTVMELDVKEEGISTLLCYLELHSSHWVENLPGVYANCKIQCYGGPGQLQAVAKKCPPVGVAIAKARQNGRNFSKTNEVEFAVVDISDTMGWDSGPVKKELKLLQWNFNTAGSGPSKTGVMVEFADLAYHFRSPGDFTVEERDDILHFLNTRIQRQERSEIRNLSKLHKALRSVSHKSHWMCADNVDMERNEKMKTILNEYFDKQSLDEEVEVEEEDDDPVPEFSMGQLVSDIRQFYNQHAQEHPITGRAIARIFHGIASPCFPATTWGRVRRYWRSHMDVDFNQLMKIATQEMISMR